MLPNSNDFKTSETKTNLMRAFTGESLARSRYTLAASQARKQKLHVIEMVFRFTAEQEKEHAEIFYNFLKDLSGENIPVEGSYPVDISESILQLLRYAQHNEYEEHDDVYAHFGETARREGFPQIAYAFEEIAKIEKLHGDRFAHFADLLERGQLFVSDVSCKWICLNCGYIYDGTEVPDVCPVCKHDRGYFLRVALTPYTAGEML